MEMWKYTISHFEWSALSLALPVHVHSLSAPRRLDIHCFYAYQSDAADRLLVACVSISIALPLHLLARGAITAWNVHFPRVDPFNCFHHGEWHTDWCCRCTASSFGTNEMLSTSDISSRDPVPPPPWPQRAVASSNTVDCIVSGPEKAASGTCEHQQITPSMQCRQPGTSVLSNRPIQRHRPHQLQ